MTFAPAFGAASWAGPVGMAIGTVAIFGQMIYDDVKDAHQYEKASEICLKAAGFNDVAAAKFSGQGPYLSLAEGASQISLLARYAALRGVSVLTLVNDLTVEVVTDASGKTIHRENADRVNSLSEIVLFAMKQGIGDPTAHRDDGKWYPAQPPVRQVSPEEAQRRRLSTEMYVLEHRLVEEKILDPNKVMPEPLIQYR
jgi:hypothetical protein